ncbi:MAG: hypothetical protein ACO1SV_12335 [Fimbriimonas sp.]
MKTIRSLLLVACLLLAIFGCASPAAADVGTATLVSTSGEISQVAITDVAKLHDVFGRKGFDVSLRAFGGFRFDGGKATGGLALSHRMNVSREAFADLGLYGRFTQGRAIGGGLFVAVGWRL